MQQSLRTSWVLLCLFLLAWGLNAQQQRPAVYKILGISVEGETSADPQAIIANSGLKVGDEITLPGEATRNAIHRLYQLRLFENIDIYVENRTQDGVYLLIRVKENPRLSQIIIKGNDELSEDDILKKINLIKGQLITPQELVTIRRLLRDEYEKEGYLNASIKPEIVASADTIGNRIDLEINIDEGPEVKVDYIRFHGNKDYDDGDLRGEMEDTKERHWWKFWTSAKFDRKKYKDDKDLIVKFYRRNGYLDAEILRDSLSYDSTKQYLTIDIWLREGPQYHVRNITWEGNTKYPTEVLDDRLGFKRGDVFNTEKFEHNLYRNEDENDVASLYYDNGYLMFQVDPDEKRIGEDSLDITLRVREGNQFRIGQVMISGNTKTYDKVIRRELFTRPGDYFSRQAIIRSLRQLQQLNYFNPEKIQPDTHIRDEKTVDLEYKVEEKSSDTFNMSVGYSGVFGFNGGLGLTFNNFSLSDPLRGGAGQVLNFDWQFGEGNRYRTFSIGFQEPWMFDTPTLFGVNLFDTRVIYYDYDYRITGGSVRVGRRFKWPDYLFRGDWTIGFQRNAVNAGGGYYNTGVTTQVSVTQVISRNSTDNPIFPSRGSSFSLLTEISGGPLLPGNANFHKHVLSIDWYVPILGSNRVALALSGLTGYVFGFTKDALIPIQDYFFMGGTGLGQFSTTPLRGYDDRSVGPRQGNVGGKAQMKFSAELRFALALQPVPIYTLLFAEGGNVWLDYKHMDPLDLKRSAGIGIRLLINPIGLVGFDYGYGFDSITPLGSPSGWKFHFQFGRSF